MLLCLKKILNVALKVTVHDPTFRLSNLVSLSKVIVHYPTFQYSNLVSSSKVIVHDPTFRLSNLVSSSGAIVVKIGCIFTPSKDKDTRLECRNVGL